VCGCVSLPCVCVCVIFFDKDCNKKTVIEARNLASTDTNGTFVFPLNTVIVSHACHTYINTHVCACFRLCCWLCWF